MLPVASHIGIRYGMKVDRILGKMVCGLLALMIDSEGKIWKKSPNRFAIKPAFHERMISVRFFNTAGPVRCSEHYCLDPLERIGLAEILSLIRQKKYFVLHAPRQTGKTTCLLALMDHINREEDFACLYANVEVGQSAREDVYQAMKAILNELGTRARIHLKDEFPYQIWPDVLNRSGENAALNEVLTQWTLELKKPLVLMMDEIDSLVGDTLISVLRQLRAGYDRRPSSFPNSVVLCGVRDVRDYRIHSDRRKSVITGGSGFNIKARSLRLGDFTKEEVNRLYQSHTDETGQSFEPEALELTWELTQGQPWLVNALAYETSFNMAEGKDRSKPITPDMAVQAKDNIILRRETHLDQLADKLGEPRVRSVIQPLLTGTAEPGLINEDDLQYVIDLGLARRKPQLSVSNPVYGEIIPRMLTATTQDVLPFETKWYVRPDGTLDTDKLLASFQEFFREHSEHWVERFDYKEAGPQLLLQAFLQRIINAGGRIDREYGLGRKRTDLLIHWKHGTGVQKVVIEMKILYKSLKRTIEEGLRQTAEYMDKCGSEDGHLIIFDRRPKKKWTEKIFRKTEAHEGKSIEVWGM